LPPERKPKMQQNKKVLANGRHKQR